MAIAERTLAAQFNKPGHEIVNHNTFVLQHQVKTIETITPGSVDTTPDKNNRNHNSRVCRYNPR
jgi:transketolase